MAVPLPGPGIADCAARLCAGALLLAQATPPGKRTLADLDTRQVAWVVFALLGVLLAGTLALYLITLWRKRAARDRLSASDQLSTFREAYEQGELSREEYDRLRSLLGQRLRREIDERPRPRAEGPPRPEPPAADRPPG